MPETRRSEAHVRWRSIRHVAATSVFVAAMAGALGPAGAVSSRSVEVRSISGRSPFSTADCPTAHGYRDTEYEPDIAANPLNGKNLVAAWAQDRQIAIVTAATMDGGRTWKKSTVPGLSRCTRGHDPSDFDSHVAFGPDGIAYLSTGTNDLATWGVKVSSSTDGGRTWAQPVLVKRGGAAPGLAWFIDFPTLTADPYRAKTAYLIWAEVFGVSVGTQWFSRTTDGGVTWSVARPLPILAPPGRVPFAGKIQVLPDGTLLDVYTVFGATPTGGPTGPADLVSIRSTDQGGTWSDSTSIASVPPNTVTDPDTGKGVGRGHSYDLPSFAVGPNGTAYVTWQVVRSAGSSQILYAKSPDGGHTWSDPRAVASLPTQAFKPTIAVTPDGTVAVTFYDFRNDVKERGGLTADYWVRQSGNGGRTWREMHVAGPFDFRSAPSPGAFPLGDYFGLAPMAGGFGAAFVMTNPVTSPTGGTDIFFAQIRPST
jgi:hypothetical protein